MMKNIIMLFCIGLLVTSCGKDKLSESIVGEWLMESISGQCGEDEVMTLLADETGCATDADGEVGCFKFTFSADGTVVGDLFGDIDNGTYTVNDETEDVTICFDGDCRTFNAAGGSMTLDLSDGDCTSKVIVVQSN